MFVNERKKMNLSDLLLILEELEDSVKASIAKHGDNALVSDAEIVGVITEEQYELVKAVHEGNQEEVVNELKDIAVAAVVGIASVRTNTRHVH